MLSSTTIFFSVLFVAHSIAPAPHHGVKGADPNKGFQTNRVSPTIIYDLELRECGDTSVWQSWSVSANASTTGRVRLSRGSFDSEEVCLADLSTVGHDGGAAAAVDCATFNTTTGSATNIVSKQDLISTI